MIDTYLARWELTPDGEPIVTLTSQLLPVRWHGTPAMLKIARADEEKAGGALMRWWDGDGAARVLASEGDALLLERAEGPNSLADVARQGRDDDACRILCGVVARLHRPRPHPEPRLTPLTEWFRELQPAAERLGGIFSLCFATAQELLATPQECVVLHGDIHHGNVLDFGARGWLAIDPKGLHGERGFDYANLFCNPDPETAAMPGALSRRATVVAREAHLERRRLLQWVLAYAGLSAAWMIGDGESPENPLQIAVEAAAELDRSARGQGVCAKSEATSM